MRTERDSGDWPFWNLIKSRWSTFLLGATSGIAQANGPKPDLSKPPCVACGGAIGELQDSIADSAGPGVMIMVTRTMAVGPFTQSEGLLFPFHRHCVDSARNRAEAEGLTWDDGDGPTTNSL